MTTWVSHAEAAALIGCGTTTIENHLDEIRRRPREGARPSLDRRSVEEFGKRWRQRRAASRRQARRRASRAELSGPPADGDEWLGAPAAGVVLGCSRQYVCRLAVNQRIAATRRGRLWWFRRSDVERYAAARASAALPQVA